ncbi:hypothetical protein [Tsukamurella paurometabola]|uniref:Uncharacterized protein n=1 Tax=Tsukamurella paurometabola TaxID=2061 RepID=A0ABS5NGN5_TSUPA|nr:hypothetical protein [Tsukamurella paurometabola]MBS4102772.1 hypothetical protein [Tsukamurella paurometabola]
MRVDDLWHALANDDVTAAALRDGAALRLSLRAAVIREIEGFEFHHLSEDARTDFAAALSRLIWGDFTEFLICVRTWRVGPPGEEVVA